MNWIDTTLFYMKSNRARISRRNLEPLLMRGCENYNDSLIRLKDLLNRNLIERIVDEKHSFQLTIEGDKRITTYYDSAIVLMKLVEQRLHEIVKDRLDIELKGNVIGLYFTYRGMTIFRFHSDKLEEDFMLFVRLPNLINEVISHKSNEIYISKGILLKTTFLENIVKAHLQMIDDYNDKET